jgi:energy-converting hydrogenase Eha subunit A
MLWILNVESPALSSLNFAERPNMRIARPTPIAALIAVVSIAHPLRTVAAQAPRFPSNSRDVETTAIFGTNVLLGGLTAVARALVSGHDPVRAFAIGALGGAVHFSGKLVGPLSGFPGGIPGVVLSSTGTAIVSNAGRGAGLFDELYVPVGPLRVRFEPRAPRKVRLTVNAAEAAVLARNLARSGMALDWERSASSGTFVFVTHGRYVRMSDGGLLLGVTIGSTVVVSSLATDPSQIQRHEVVHVRQLGFLEDAVGRPIEDYLRTRIPGVRRIPRWLELGVVPIALEFMESALFGGDGPVRRLGESEADMLGRR